MKEKCKYYFISIILTSLILLFFAGLSTVDFNTSAMSAPPKTAQAFSPDNQKLDIQQQTVYVTVLNTSFAVPQTITDTAVSVGITCSLIKNVVLGIASLCG